MDNIHIKVGLLSDEANLSGVVAQKFPSQSFADDKSFHHQQSEFPRSCYFAWRTYKDE